MIQTGLIQRATGSPQATSGGSSRWVERAVLVDARGTVRAAEFAPHHFGLKLVDVSSDNHVRIYECLEQSSLATWQLSEEVNISTLPSVSLLSSYSMAFATPTQTSALLKVHLQPWSLKPCSNRKTPPLRDDPEWGIEKQMEGGAYHGIIQLSLSLWPTTLLSSPAGLPAEAGTSLASDGDTPIPFAITSVAWAPMCGRLYHLIATGGRNGHVRICLRRKKLTSKKKAAILNGPQM
ncbi:hypothetical protein EV702DRAFT_1205547 [Suillus placidus]|uniref:Uncharacterized protein n=1 Tax=Suillus placidus TaxID=48579 RepID=A0A9P6ZFE5_9AGAM|nr:hypothetical protein EV702DRAFT_1205547 [Suillus placidus]